MLVSTCPGTASPRWSRWARCVIWAVDEGEGPPFPWVVALPVPACPPGNLREEVHGDAHKLIGLFQVGSMPTRLDHHEIRPRDGLVIEGPTFHGDDLILPPPDDARRHRDPGEQSGQARVVHRGLPGQPDSHLAVLHYLFAFGWTRLEGVELGIFRDLLRVVETSGLESAPGSG